MKNCFARFRAVVLCVLLSCIFVLPASARPWKAICASGKLRVLTTRSDHELLATEGLPRREMPIHRERALLHAFAETHHLNVEYVTADSFASLFHLLESDEGDLISANLAVTEGRKAKFLLSVPFDETNEVFFTGASSKIKGSGIEALYDGATGQLLPGTTYAEYMRLVYGNDAKMKWKTLPATISHDELIEKVANGEIDYSVLNECDLDSWLAYRSDIRKLFPLRLHVPLVFAANKKSAELIRQLNLFLEPPTTAPETKPAAEPPKPESKPKRRPQRQPGGDFGDLAAIKKRGYIRVLMRNEYFGCYLHRGELCGFEYELVKRFAKGIGVDVVTVIPPDFDDMVKQLEAGKGDLIAANFSRTAERMSAYPGLTFCSPYGSVREVLIGRRNEKITKLSDLAGRRICVRKGNSYYHTLLKLQKAGNFTIEAVPENEGMFDISRKVISGKYDLTAADETYVDIADASGIKLKKLLVLSENNRFAWVVRKKNPQLAAAVNAFFKKEYRGTFYNLCWKRYYTPSQRRVQSAKQDLVLKRKTLSPYDAIFQKYGKRYGFEWYFLAAQAYQETRFKADTVNHIGAAGLMQVTPTAAKEVGIGNLTNPDNGVHAGTKYLAKMRKKFEGSVKPEDQLCFTLAAYNAGYGHVSDARRLAARKGWNPNVWFDHTERALALLEQQRYASHARFGYCRASETIPYVRNIMLNTHNYQKLLEARTAEKGGQTSGKK